MFLRPINNPVTLIFSLTLLSIPPISIAAPPSETWTLEKTIQRGVQIAPESTSAQAVVDAAQGALHQAGAWQNPQIEMRFDDKLGKEDGSGGTDFTQFSIAQSLPLSGRIKYRKAIAGESLDAADAERRYQQIHLETTLAQYYHSLQLATERLQLAEQRLQLADELQNTGRRRAQAGELSNLERLRLELVRENAKQVLDKAEGAYNEALSRFRAYLGLMPESTPKLEPLKPFSPIPSMETLQNAQKEHPALLAAKHRVGAAQSNVDLARAERIPDPTLKFFHEQDYLNGRRQNINGVGIGITLPLWNRNKGRIDEVQAQAIQVESDQLSLQRDLTSRMQLAYLHLNHLVEQAERYKTKVFEPAQKVFDMTRKAYASGEVEILSLIDANNTYFDAHDGYLTLLEKAWLEAADLRMAAGISLISNLPQGNTL